MAAQEIWLIVCIFLVLLQQVGFLLLESGLVRTKNNVNVAAKNIIDFCLVVLLFWFVGQHVVFGIGLGNTSAERLMFLYHALFCATCVTLISGAISERVHIRAYLLIAVLTSVFIYPFFAYNVWHEHGSLALIGFVDMAGAAVVHVVGGAVTLAALLVIGPRIGIFKDGKKVAVASNMAMAVAGGFILFVGWLGFNGGASYGTELDASLIIMNTVFAASGAGCFAVVANIVFSKVVDVKNLVNAILAGLVASSAASHLLAPVSSILLGVIAYLVMLGLSNVLVYFQIDDAVDAVPVHLGGGAVGVVAPVMFTDSMALGVQVSGLLLALVWGFGIAYAVLRLANRFFPLRVDEEAEQLGLNIFEHGERNDLSEMIASINENVQSGDLTKPLPQESASEVGLLASHYNSLLERISAQQRSLRSLLDESKRLQRVKDDFVATLNHEIRTPITAVKGFAQRLCDLSDDGSEVRELSTRVLNAGDRLEVLSHQLLNLEQLEARALTVHAQPEKLTDVLAWLESNARAQFDQSGVVLHYTKSLADSASQEFDLDIDRPLLEEALHEVCANAIKFGEGESVDMRVSLNHSKGACLELSLVNEGATIGKNCDPYEKFWQADSSLSRQHDGLGLGLFIAKRYLNLMGGNICHREIEAHGSIKTEFVVSLPCTPKQNQDGLPSDTAVTDEQIDDQNPAVSEQTSISYEGKRCLVVDDTMDNQLLIEFAMTELGFECETADNGQVALDMLREKTFDVVMMDMQMPIMDGVTATRAIREELNLDQRTLPIIAITANDLQVHREQCFDAGMNEFLTKPLDASKLAAVLKEVVND